MMSVNTRQGKRKCSFGTAQGRGLVLTCLLLIGGAGRAVIESPPVNVDEIRWKSFTAPSSEVYIDTTLQFTPSLCSIQNVNPKKDKLALWLDVDASATPPRTNLCVYASQTELAPAAPGRLAGMVLGATRAETSTRPTVFRLRDTESIEPARWYRLTVRTIADVTRRAARTHRAAHGLLGFQIYLDGRLLFSDTPTFTPHYLSFATSSDGWLSAAQDADWISFLRSGAVFVSLCGESADASVGSVGFHGDGELGDVDVTGDAPHALSIDSLDFSLSLTPRESVLAELLAPAPAAQR